MLDGMLNVLGGGIISILTLAVNAIIEYKKDKNVKQQKLYTTKRVKLTEIYTNLSKIVNLFPNSSPNDMLKYIEDPPFYDKEKFIPIKKILKRKLSCYEDLLQDYDLELHQRDNLENKKYNIENVLSAIGQIEEDYFKARECYKRFLITDKAIFDLYAGQNVRNKLVEFEVVINNVFVSGNTVVESSDPVGNIIDKARRRLIDSMREDIGIW